MTLTKTVAELDDSLRIQVKALADAKIDFNNNIEAERVAHANTKAITDKIVNDAKNDVDGAIDKEKKTSLRADSLEREKMELKISIETMKYEQAKEIDRIKTDCAKEIDKVKTDSFNALASSNTTLESVMQSVQQMKIEKENELVAEKEAHFRTTKVSNETINDLQNQVHSLEDQLDRYNQAKEQFHQALSVPPKPKRNNIDSPSSSSSSIPQSPASP